MHLIVCLRARSRQLMSNTSYYTTMFILFAFIGIFIVIGIGLYLADKDEQWEPKKRNPNEMSDREFSIAFYNGVQKLANLPLNDIADKLLVSRPTVSRWMKCKNLPHPILRRLIIDKLNSIKN